MWCYLNCDFGAFISINVYVFEEIKKNKIESWTYSNKDIFQDFDTNSLLRIHPNVHPYLATATMPVRDLPKDVFKVLTHHLECALCDSWVLPSLSCALYLLCKTCVVWPLSSLTPLAFDSHHPKLALFDSWVLRYLYRVSPCSNVSQRKRAKIDTCLWWGLYTPLSSPPHTLVCHMAQEREEIKMMSPPPHKGLGNVFQSSLRVALNEWNMNFYRWNLPHLLE